MTAAVVVSSDEDVDVDVDVVGSSSVVTDDVDVVVVVSPFDTVLLDVEVELLPTVLVCVSKTDDVVSTIQYVCVCFFFFIL